MKTFLLMLLIPLSVWAQPVRGFRLEKLESDSVLAKLGLREGDVIKKVNDKVIDSPEAAKMIMSELKNSKTIRFVIERNGQEEILKYKVKTAN